MGNEDFFRIFGRYLAGLETKISRVSVEGLAIAGWNNLVKCAEDLGAELLVYGGIKDCDPSGELMPPAIDQKLKKEYLNRTVRNTRLFHEAKVVLTAFRGDDIPVIVLKGLSLAEDLYGDIALRSMGDIDILVKSEDLVRAGRLLLSIGYDQKVSSWEKMIADVRHLPTFVKYANGATVEVHGNIVHPASPFNIDVDGLWERSRLIKINGIEAMALSFEDLFIHLCLHASYQHRFRIKFIHFCDIARLVNIHKKDMDWPLLIKMIRELGAQRCVYLTLCFIRKFIGAGVPDNVMNELRPDGFNTAFLTAAQEEVFHKGSGKYNGVRRSARILNVKGLRGWASYFWVRLILSRAYLAHMYRVPVSSPRIYLCYVRYICHTVFEYSRTLILLVSQDRSAAGAVRDERAVNAFFDWMEYPALDK